MSKGFPASTYAEDAPPTPPAPALRGTCRADVAVVGAGITGLSAALHLAEAGAAVAVLDRVGPGWGASGRNGGQVNPGLKLDPDEIARIGGERLVHDVWTAPDLVFALIERHRIACEAARGGTLRAAAATADLPALQSLGEQCARRALGTTLLDAGAIAARTGATQYRAALFDPRGGQLNPLAYTRGLAAAAARLGVALHGDSAVTRLERAPFGWRLHGAGFSLDADTVVLAGNGYTDGLWPKLARSIVPVFSAIVASAPLPPPLRASILAAREVLYELGAVTTYYRVDAAGRLLIGGRSRSCDLSGPAAFPFLARHAERLWPALRGIGWTHGWNGQLAMTTDHLPHWHEPAPGLLACLGYNGRGVAMATLMGRELARRATGMAAADLLLAASAVHPIPLHRFWKLGVGARIAWGRATDRLHQRRNDP